MARAALQFPNGRLQFGRDGVAEVIIHAGVGAVGPIFWHNEVKFKTLHRPSHPWRPLYSLY